MGRTGPPENESLWDDLPLEGREGPAARRTEPPDWALPAWDAIDEPETGATSRLSSPGRDATRPVGASQPATPTPPEPRSLAPSPGPGETEFALRIMGVSEVTRAVRDAVRSDPGLRDVWVEGEVGRVTVSSAGHCYFTLKDERSQLACVFFRDDRLASPFEARTGLRVVVHGRVDLFEAQGVYQLYVASVQPAGFGDLALRFEGLKARLAAEGLFDSARKRPLPYRPAVIGVATSATGAVWHDICHVIARRWPLARLVLAPCQVQGDGAAASVVAALDRLARWGEKCRVEGRPDEAPAVVILARGGGSLEDLWSFNDEKVVRAVVAHPVPVVCGVGHEVDVTLADFAADVRAATPSAAAELVVPDRIEVASGIAELTRRGGARAAAALLAARNELAAEGRALDRLQPAAQLAAARERAGYLLDRATRCLRDEVGRRRALDAGLAARLAPTISSRLAAGRTAMERSAAALAALGPQATLDRGYAIVRRDADGAVVRDPVEAPSGELLAITVARGDLAARVEGDEPGVRSA
ncbi:MAG: exodeoxyribonuclease VII large subunit [Candidatus Limnocylindrales bacterium]|jgi:exodeoxyribonuclease VII large subunit